MSAICPFGELLFVPLVVDHHLGAAVHGSVVQCVVKWMRAVRGGRNPEDLPLCLN
jgi:hypothetical protein